MCIISFFRGVDLSMQLKLTIRLFILSEVQNIVLLLFFLAVTVFHAEIGDRNGKKIKFSNIVQSIAVRAS